MNLNNLGLRQKVTKIKDSIKFQSFVQHRRVVAVAEGSPDHPEGDELRAVGKRETCSRQDPSRTQQTAFDKSRTGRSENSHGTKTK